jgi:CelD/BcsL family acetyltransferase involved in cellulose biosynthesis
MTSGWSIEIAPATRLDARMRAAWADLRAANPDLWSPFFDLRLVESCARHAPRAHVAIAHRAGRIGAFLPFQGRRGGFARPLGAPLSDQHGLIAAPGEGPSLVEVVTGAGLAGYGHAALVGEPGPGATPVDLHVADLTDGVEVWHAHRAAHHGEHLKKSARRRRAAEREWGEMRVAAVTGDPSLLETALAWKSEKLRATGRHDIMATGWIRNWLTAMHASADPDFHAEIWTLHFGDKLAALEYCLHAGGVTHSWFPSFDAAFAKASPGTLLMDAMIAAAGARGDRLVDLGAGHDHYKRYSANAVAPRSQGVVRVKGPRTTLMGLLDAASARAPETWRDTLAKVRRRGDMILSAEPTWAGRARGALRAIAAARAAD